MTDNTPDFDSMSPEELMAWMESLAKRQGASEGFTTAADMEVAEIDPSSVQLDEPGYIPYGMDTEQWEARRAEEERIKAERRAAQQAAQPAPAPEPAPAPVAQAQPASTGAGELDPENMTPEQLMAWMESLAKRQGASEGFTTAADMQIAEIDPSTVSVDEPGYIPYGMDAEQWAAKQAEEAARKAARQPSQTSPPAPVAPSAPPAPEPQMPAASSDMFLDDEETTQLTPAPHDALSWLESLAADGGSGVDPVADLDALDLSDLGAALAQTDTPEDPMAWLESLSAGQGDQIPGLENLALDLSDIAQPPKPAGIASPATENSLEWLESLARRQGADEEEFITAASVDVPETAPPPQDAPGYTDFSFESVIDGSDDLDLSGLSFDDEPDAEPALSLDDMDDPNDWLSALASGQIKPGASPFVDTPAVAGDEDILSALQQGKDVSPDTMADWMGNLLDVGARRTDISDYIDDTSDSEEILQAELPDWLVQQVGTPPPIDDLPPTRKTDTLPLVEDILPPSDVDMPDWLKADVDAGEPASSAFDFDSIFADEEEDELTPIASALGDIPVDTSDPWVEAFEEELQQGDGIPAWYLERLSKAGVSTKGDSLPGVGDTFQYVAQPADEPADVQSAPATLKPASFPPENELAMGDLQAVPAWMNIQVEAPSAPPPATATASPEPVAQADDSMPDWLRQEILEADATDGGDDLPDWLKEAGISEEAVSDMPDWLRETLPTDEVKQVKPAEPVASAPPPAPVVAVPAPAKAPMPVPVPVPVAPAIDVDAALAQARTSLQHGDLDASLQSYEAIVRANHRVEVVVQDLTRLISDERHKQNPAVYRVLGDSLMRKGDLQQALDTYRKALNLL